jgi:hypothetical protein
MDEGSGASTSANHEWYENHSRVQESAALLEESRVPLPTPSQGRCERDDYEAHATKNDVAQQRQPHSMLSDLLYDVSHERRYGVWIYLSTRTRRQ